MPKISIIIPFHNVENYIKQCLDSVVAQTLQDIEVICVNDASSDKSREIVEEYLKQDSRIKIIDIPQRQGQGYARNRAIEIATGEYIGFVDSDDWIEPDMFFELYNKAKDNDDDIVFCQAREYDDLNEKFIFSDYYSLKILDFVEDKVFSARKVQDKLLDINVVLWNKIYKKSFLDRIGEKFPEGFIYEDLPFFFGTFLNAQKIQIVWKNLYMYRINRKNSTMQQFNNKILDRLDMVSLTYEKLCRMNFSDEILNRIKGWIIDDLFHRYFLSDKNYRREFFFRMKQIFQSLDINDHENPFWKTVYHYEGYLLVLNNDFESFNQILFSKYIDIVEVENRLNSKFNNTYDIDYKLSHIYDEITKNYEFTKLLNEDVKKQITVVQTEINDKLDKLFDRQTDDIRSLNNYAEKSIQNFIQNMTQEEQKKINDIKNEFEYKNNEIRNLIKNNSDDINSYIDNQIKKIQENHEKEKEDLQKEFKNKINLQKQEYESRIQVLETKLANLEKPLLKKIKEKLKRHK